MTAENKPPIPEHSLNPQATPSKDQDPFIPRFSLTTSIEKLSRDRDINRENYIEFAENLDKYLIEMANAEGLLAFGIVAVSSSEGLADFITPKGGYAVDAVSYWEVPQKPWERDGEWDDLEGDNSYIVPAFFQSYSKIDYPTLEWFHAALANETSRSKFTETAEHCEFWGLVTTDELRKELTIQQSAHPGI